MMKDNLVLKKIVGMMIICLECGRADRNDGLPWFHNSSRIC